VSPDELLQLDRDLRAEAAPLLDKLRALFPFHIIGSYALELMVWRDLDLLLRAPSVTVDEFFELGRRITATLSPWKAFFTDDRRATPPAPRGLYWGIRLGDVSQGAWKIDLWWLDPTQTKKRLAQRNALQRRLTPSNRVTILRLKSQLWRDPRYRKEITSQDIYDAVLDRGIQSLEEL
jgi:hypothetical protein